MASCGTHFAYPANLVVYQNKVRKYIPLIELLLFKISLPITMLIAKGLINAFRIVYVLCVVYTYKPIDTKAFTSTPPLF